MPKKDIGGINPFQFGGGDDSETTDIPVSQYTYIPVDQHTSKQVEQQTDIPVSKSTDKQVLFRATYYISAEEDDKLERIRLARRRRGQKVDKSAIIREAIALLPEV